MSYIKYFAVLVVSVLMLAANAESQTLIDNFTDGGFFSQMPTGTTYGVVDGTGSNILGGERDVVLTCVSGTGPGVQANITGGLIYFQSGNGATGTLSLTYDGNDDTAEELNPLGLAGVVDLTDVNASVIGIDVSMWEKAYDLTIVVYSGDGSNQSTWTATVNAAGYLEAPFTSFTNTGGSGADFTDVFAVVITLDARANPYMSTAFNFVASYHPPNLIELVSFTSLSDSDSVTLAWETASEADNAGFHIWRSDSEDGEYVRITDALISAQGDSVTGASYVYEDLDASGAGYSYQLEDIDYNGVSTFHDLTARYVALASGWNILDGDAFAGLSVSGALSSIAGNYSSVWGLTASGWQMYDPVQPTFSDLETFEGGNDYWLYVTVACKLALP